MGFKMLPWRKWLLRRGQSLYPKRSGRNSNVFLLIITVFVAISVLSVDIALAKKAISKKTNSSSLASSSSSFKNSSSSSSSKSSNVNVDTVKNSSGTNSNSKSSSSGIHGTPKTATNNITSQKANTKHPVFKGTSSGKGSSSSPNNGKSTGPKKYVTLTKSSRQKGSGSIGSKTSSSSSPSASKSGSMSGDGSSPISKSRTRESFGLSMAPPGDMGIQESNWVGIDKGQFERGGLYTEGLDLDLTNPYADPTHDTPSVLPGSTLISDRSTDPSAFLTPVIEHGTLLSGQSTPAMMNPNTNFQRQERLERRVIELESLMQTMTRNVEVMQQNTQVISKGFNILSGRVNSFSAEYEHLHTTMSQKYLLLGDKIMEHQKNLTTRMTEFELKTSKQVEELRQTDKDLVETQVTAGHQHKLALDQLVKQAEGWKSGGDNETKILAEMVKALAEISKKEKTRTDNISLALEKTTDQLNESLKKLQVEDANNCETFSSKIKLLRTEFQESANKSEESTEALKQALGSLSKHVEDQMKRLDEAILEQNMAHNLAHENIAQKFDDFDGVMERRSGAAASVAAVETSSRIMDADLQDLLQRLYRIETNVSSLVEAGGKTLGKIESLEDTDTSILSRIADMRNAHKHENFTSRKELESLGQSLSEVREELKSLRNRLSSVALDKKKDSNDNKLIYEMGGLSMGEPPTNPTLRITEGDPMAELNLGEIKDRFVTLEENVGELWRTQKDLKHQHENFSTHINDLKNNHLKDIDDLSLQIMDVKVATKLLTDLMRNTSKSLIEVEKKIEIGADNSRTSSRAIAPREEILRLQDQLKTTQDNIAHLWESSKNVSKAQEFFLLKLLEMDLEHKADNKTVGSRIQNFNNYTVDFMFQLTRADDRINKVVQQFEITDSEQVKIREELLNIKDRMASSEENHSGLWKTIRKFEIELEEILNNLDNIILIHKTENKNITGEMAVNKETVANLTKQTTILNDRVANIELVMDMDVSTESKSSELGKLKSRLTNSEKDIAELWKSSEILSFQQQVFSENVKILQHEYNNETALANVDRVKTKYEALNLLELYSNLSQRVLTVEKCTNPPYEAKMVDFEIHEWQASLANGLKDQHIFYELGDLLEIPSSWKAFVELNGDHLSVYNTLVKATGPVYNEFSAEILDSDGRTFASFGPDLHLYRANNEKIGWTNMVSIQSLQLPANRILEKNALKLRLRVKVYPKPPEIKPQEEGPSEKQLIHWEITPILEKLRHHTAQNNEAFSDLNITKEFGAGHYWGGHTLWKTALLVREINHQNYLGINMELVENDGSWKELAASYNVTLMDAQSRIVKEFSIASNDFTTVSARHSYFILVKDLEEVLKRGDHLTFRIYFDLRAKRRSFDVEIIR